MQRPGRPEDASTNQGLHCLSKSPKVARLTVRPHHSLHSQAAEGASIQVLSVLQMLRMISLHVYNSVSDKYYTHLPGLDQVHDMQVQSNGLAALQRLDAHLSAIEGAIAGLEAAQKQSAAALPEAVAAALPSALLHAQQSGMLPEAINSSTTVREGSLSIDGQDQLRRLVSEELSRVTQQIVAAQVVYLELCALCLLCPVVIEGFISALSSLCCLLHLQMLHALYRPIAAWLMATEHAFA